MIVVEVDRKLELRRQWFILRYLVYGFFPKYDPANITAEQ